MLRPFNTKLIFLQGVDPEEEDAEQLKLQKEYEESLEEFKKEQEQFREQHPDQAVADEMLELEDELVCYELFCTSKFYLK